MDLCENQYQKRPPSAYRLNYLHLAGRQIGYSDEACLIEVEAQELPAPQARNPSMETEFRIHFTTIQYALLKRLLEHCGQLVPFVELIAIVQSFPTLQPTLQPINFARALANHIYRVKKKLPKYMLIHCETGVGYTLLILTPDMMSERGKRTR